MEDWQYVESRFDDLADQLETAKAHILKVHLDFETRIRVWEHQVLPDRLETLKKNSSLETAIRHYDLTIKDVSRLYRRAEKEFLKIANDVNIKQSGLKFHQQLFQDRKELIVVIHDGYVNDLRDITEKA